MTNKSPHASALVWILTCATILPGCTSYAAFKECGFAGCKGDADIANTVRQQIAQHPGIGAPDAIQVQTIDHVVYLYGLVDTDLQKSLAEAAAHAPGVTRVVDSIAVRNGIL